MRRHARGSSEFFSIRFHPKLGCGYYLSKERREESVPASTEPAQSPQVPGMEVAGDPLPTRALWWGSGNRPIPFMAPLPAY